MRADLEELRRDGLVARFAGPNLVVGGSDPFILLSTDDLDGVVESAVAARDPSSPDAALGPLSSATAADRLEDQLRRAVGSGATLAGGARRGNFVSPGVVTGVTPGNDVYREELFGPVAIVHRVGSEDEAVEVANDTPFGLGSYVFTTDPDQALRVADRIDAGMVFIKVVGAATQRRNS